jgi:hypothetical protein
MASSFEGFSCHIAMPEGVVMRGKAEELVPIAMDASASKATEPGRERESWMSAGGSGPDTAWLEASAVELGRSLRELESDLPEEAISEWLAAFEE